MEHHLRSTAARAAPLITVDRSGHTVIQNARMLQSASGEDVALLLSLARRALQTGEDLTEQLELSRGAYETEIRIVRSGAGILGVLVSLDQTQPARDRPTFPVALEWSPMVGRSAAMQRLFREAGRVARHRMAVTIWGEPGTGKLMLAQHLHRSGGKDPLTIVHCTSGDWELELARARRTGGTAVLRRPHALGPAAQLRLCDLLDELAEEGPEVWVIGLLNPLAERPGAELLSPPGPRVTRGACAARSRPRPRSARRQLVQRARLDDRRASGAAARGDGGPGGSAVAGQRPRADERAGRGGAAGRGP